MGVPTVAESQLQRPSGSGVATATVDRPLSTGQNSRDTPPLYLVPLGARAFRAGWGQKPVASPVSRRRRANSVDNG